MKKIINLLLLVSLAAGLSSCNKVTTKSISFDINPSFEIYLNDDNKVVGYKGYNEEGIVFCKQNKVVGKKASEIVDPLVNYLKENGYYSDDTISALITYSNEVSTSLRNTIDKSFKTSIENLEINPSIVSQYFTFDDENIISKSQELDISYGLASLSNKLSLVYPSFSVEELATLNTDELIYKFNMQFSYDTTKTYLYYGIEDCNFLSEQDKQTVKSYFDGIGVLYTDLEITQDISLVNGTKYCKIDLHKNNLDYCVYVNLNDHTIDSNLSYTSPLISFTSQQLIDYYNESIAEGYNAIAKEYIDMFLRPKLLAYSSYVYDYIHVDGFNKPGYTLIESNLMVDSALAKFNISKEDIRYSDMALLKDVMTRPFVINLITNNGDVYYISGFSGSGLMICGYKNGEELEIKHEFTCTFSKSVISAITHSGQY